MGEPLTRIIIPVMGGCTRTWTSRPVTWVPSACSLPDQTVSPATCTASGVSPKGLSQHNPTHTVRPFCRRVPPCQLTAPSVLFEYLTARSSDPKYTPGMPFSWEKSLVSPLRMKPRERMLLTLFTEVKCQSDPSAPSIMMEFTGSVSRNWRNARSYSNASHDMNYVFFADHLK